MNSDANHSGSMPPPASPPALDPPFRGYIETTYDALLVFEAARRGMIPRVTRRLIERERGMVQSGAVFVFDEHESGIKRWTDGLVWSPSRILGNFLVSRRASETVVPCGRPMLITLPTGLAPRRSIGKRISEGIRATATTRIRTSKPLPLQRDRKVDRDSRRRASPVLTIPSFDNDA